MLSCAGPASPQVSTRTPVYSTTSTCLLARCNAARMAVRRFPRIKSRILREQNAIFFQTKKEVRDNLLLQLMLKVDKHIAAANEIQLGERRILWQRCAHPPENFSAPAQRGRAWPACRPLRPWRTPAPKCAPRPATHLRGMPSKPDEYKFCTTTNPPAACTCCTPREPSLPVPDKITATPRAPISCANDCKNTSMGRLSVSSGSASVNSSFPSERAILVRGGLR